MSYLTQISTSTLSNQNLSSALLVHTYTEPGTRLRQIFVDVFADQIAGNGDYVIYATRQLAGTGSTYEIGARTTVSVPSGVTAQAFQTIPLTCGLGDVIKIYLLGLAGDTTTPSITTNVSEEFVETDASGQVSLTDGAITTAKVGTGVLVGTLPGGQYTVAVTVEDSVSLVGIPDVLVTVKDSADAVVQDQKRTDSSGVATFSLDAATYKVHVFAVGYQALADQTLVISANAAATYDVVPISIGSPTDPSLCRVYGYEYLGATPIAGSSVSAVLINPPQTTATTIQELIVSSTTSDFNGYWSLDLVRGKAYSLEIPTAGVKRAIVVPDADSVNARGLL